MFVFFFMAQNHCSELNQSADLLSFSNTLMSSSIVFLASYIVICRIFKSFIKILNRMGLKIESCGIPDKSI